MADKPEDMSDKAIAWVLIFAVLAALGLLVWWFFSDQIKNSIRWIRYGEIWVISKFVGEDYTIDYGGRAVDYDTWVQGIPQIQPQALDGQTLSIISHLAGEPLKWPVTILFLILAYMAYTKGPNSQHRISYDLNSFIRRMANMFPVISPLVRFNPNKQPPRAPGSPIPADLPLFAEALGPEEWLAYNNIPVPDGKVDKDAARRAFKKQLGKRWKGAKNLAPYKQILLASFCLKAARKRDEADMLLSRLSGCWSHDKGLKLGKDRKLLAESRKILTNRAIAAPTLAKCNQHAWETTALLRGLLNAREEGGVLAPAQFLWLRGHDRALWYPLNNLGRQAFHLEALGAMSHFKIEKMTKRPIPRPKLEDAADSIVDYMGQENARPIPQIDYSDSKKRGIKKLKTA